MKRFYVWPVALVMLLLPTLVLAQTHGSELPELTPDAQFPRCSESQLAAAGFPDHMHAHNWYGWEVLVDDAGRPYGPGSLCTGKVRVKRDDLVSMPGEQRLGQFIMMHNPGYDNCDMLPFLELVEWANHVVPDLLGLSITDTLTILNPDNTQHYIEQTGQGVWRLYQLQGNVVTIEPVPVLRARTLDAHAAFMLITDWILSQALDQDLPSWLHHGLVEYISEDGPHLTNYMAEFRGEESILFSAPLVDAILSKGVDPDEGTDRENFRRARYSAFLMTYW